MRSNLHISAFRGRLKARRKLLGMTQGDLAEKTGISIKTINTWESGDDMKVGPRSDHIISLCKALDCSFEYLFGGDEYPTLEHKQIQSEIGLSTKAIDRLRFITLLGDEKALTFISELIFEPLFYSAIEDYFCAEAIRKENNNLKEEENFTRRIMDLSNLELYDNLTLYDVSATHKITEKYNAGRRINGKGINNVPLYKISEFYKIVADRALIQAANHANSVVFNRESNEGEETERSGDDGDNQKA